jgi:hypothetical protein
MRAKINKLNGDYILSVVSAGSAAKSPVSSPSLVSPLW